MLKTSFRELLERQDSLDDALSKIDREGSTQPRVATMKLTRCEEISTTSSYIYDFDCVEMDGYIIIAVIIENKAILYCYDMADNTLSKGNSIRFQLESLDPNLKGPPMKDTEGMHEPADRRKEVGYCCTFGYMTYPNGEAQNEYTAELVLAVAGKAGMIYIIKVFDILECETEGEFKALDNGSWLKVAHLDAFLTGSHRFCVEIERKQS